MQTCPDDVATVQSSAGEWHGALKLIIHVIIGDGSTQDATPCVRLEFLKNVMDPGAFANGDAEQVILQCNKEFDHGRLGYEKCDKLVRCIDTNMRARTCGHLLTRRGVKGIKL
jgi:hypothetical protein